MLLQYVSEKIGGAKGTELEDDIVDMEKVTLLSFQCSHRSWKSWNSSFDFLGMEKSWNKIQVLKSHVNILHIV